MKSRSDPSPSHRVTFLWQPLVLGSYLSPQTLHGYTSQSVNRSLPLPRMPFVHKWHAFCPRVCDSRCLFCGLGEQFDPGGDLPQLPSLVPFPLQLHPHHKARPGWRGCREAKEEYLAGLHRASCQLSWSHLLPEGGVTRKCHLTGRCISI